MTVLWFLDFQMKVNKGHKSQNALLEILKGLNEIIVVGHLGSLTQTAYLY